MVLQESDLGRYESRRMSVLVSGDSDCDTAQQRRPLYVKILLKLMKVNTLYSQEMFGTASHTPELL